MHRLSARPPPLVVSPELRRRYADGYAGPSEWRGLCARDKAHNVIALCGGIPHGTVLEIGAGDGALLERLAALEFARSYDALEISPSAVEAVRARGIAGLAACQLYDGYHVPYDDGAFDLAILSHVVEHLEHPRALLREAARVAAHVFVEVPLEDTWRLARDYLPDPVGHINFYTRASLRRLVQSCGLEVLGERVAAGAAAAARRRGRGGALRHAVKRAALGVWPGLATRVFTYHGSLLCRASRDAPSRETPA